MNQIETYVIHLTKSCNMECIYCYEDDKTSGHQKWNSIKRVLDRIIESEYNEFQIEFLGGEPLLNYKMMIKTREYLDEMDAPVVRFKVTTNGTVLQDKVLKEFKSDDRYYIGVSHDGTRYMNQMRVLKPDDRGERVNPYETVIDNIKTLLDEVGDDRVGVHMVIHPYNVAWLKMGVDHMYDIGVRIIDIGIIENTLPRTEEFKSKFISEHKKISKAYKNGDYKGARITSFNEPKESNKVYIKDENGVTVAENFRDTDNHVNDNMDDYHLVGGTYESSKDIYELRKEVYKNHKKIVGD